MTVSEPSHIRDLDYSSSSTAVYSSTEPKRKYTKGRKIKRKIKKPLEGRKGKPHYSLNPLGNAARLKPGAEPESAPVIPFRFLDLAPELRNHVYTYALKGNPAGWIGRANYQHTDHNEEFRTASLHCPKGANVNLIRCCKQIHQETKILLYKLNIFNLSLKHLPSLQEVINIKQPIKSWSCWSKIKHLKIHGSVEKIPDFVVPLISLQGLRIHTLNLHILEEQAKDLLKLSGLRVYGSVSITVRSPPAMDRALLVSQLRTLLTDIMRKFLCGNHDNLFD
jgi:hypothetical protein